MPGGAKKRCFNLYSCLWKEAEPHISHGELLYSPLHPVISVGFLKKVEFKVQKWL